MMSNFNKMLRENRGFTLVELIVVIAVLGILAGIAVPRLTGVRDKADKETLRANANSLKRAIDMYIAENDELPKDGSELDFGDSDYNIDFSTDDYDISDFSARDSELDTDDYSIDISNDDYEVTITDKEIGEVDDK